MLWLDQIGDFFLNLSVTATRLDGSTFTVHPIYASPEGEGNAPDYGDGQPKIVFFDYDIKEDTQLLEGDPTMVVRKDLDGDGIVDTAEVQGKPHPYILYFQVELITYWREDDLALRTIWQQLFPDRGGIDVYDSHEDSVVNLFYHRVGYAVMDSKERDSQQGRVYRKVYRYAIHTQLDSLEVRTYKTVKYLPELLVSPHLPKE